MNGHAIYGLSADRQRANMLYCNNYKLTPVVRWCLEEFYKLDSYFINVNCCVFIDGKGGYFEPPEQIYLSQDYQGVQQLVALFHELRHYVQFKTGMWNFDPTPFIRPPNPEWTPIKAKFERFLDYLEYPWEIDAREKSMETLRAFWKHPVSSSFSSLASESASAFPSLTRR